MNTLDKKYTDLLQDILDNGVKKETRNGGTISVFGHQIRHKMSEGFPLLTTKKMYFKGIVTELLWFLRGDTNIKYLIDNDCHIWDGDAYKNWCRQFEVDPNNFDVEEVAKGHNDQCWGYPILDHVKPTSKEYKRGQINAYLEGKAKKPFFYLSQEEFVNKIKTDDEFAKKWGELGPIYGKQWRSWYWRSEPVLPGEKDMIYTTEGKPVTWSQDKYIDQIQNLINDLKTNPDSRRLMVTAWNPAELDQMTLPPCHYGFQVYTRELSLEERVSIWDKKFLDSVKPEESMDNLDLDHDNIPTRAISLMWNQRSVDTFLGLPFNIASYGLLLEIIAKEVNMVPDELIGNLGDTHLYLNHIEQAREQIGRELSLEERKQIFEDSGYVCDVWPFNGDWNGEYDGFGIPRFSREPYPLPTLKHMKTDEFYKSLSEDFSLFTHLDNTDFIIENYQSHPSIKAPLSN